MPTQEVNGVVVDYKGRLIQYCHEQGLGQPRFTETQHGPSDTPSWKVTVHYGDRVYETADAVQGTKKSAHQSAAKKILEAIAANQENLLGGDVAEVESVPEPEPEIAPEPEIVPEPEAPKPHLEIALPLVTSALTIASERLEALHPMRYRRLSDVEFSRKLANLTMKIARELVTEAEKANITFSQE